VPLYLPDTNALSRHVRGHDVGLSAKFAEEFAHVRLSAVVLAELEFGAAKSGLARHRTRLDGLLATLPVEPFTHHDADHYGRLRAALQRRGEMIGPLDALIAAQALRLGATIVTHNVREFARVPGLKCEDWQAA
jgi:tRNA(fMet)-specific endonuclease VapC